MLMNLTNKMCLKITLLQLLPHLSGENELILTSKKSIWYGLAKECGNSPTNALELPQYFTLNFSHIHHPLQWHHNEQDGFSNHCCLDSLLNNQFRHRSRKTSKLCVPGLCEGNSLVTGEFPTQRASNVENVSIWWRHHDKCHDATPTSSPAWAPESWAS